MVQMSVMPSFRSITCGVPLSLRAKVSRRRTMSAERRPAQWISVRSRCSGEPGSTLSMAISA